MTSFTRAVLDMNNIVAGTVVSLVLMALWITFMAMQPPMEDIVEREGPAEGTPAARRAARHQRMLSRAREAAGERAAAPSKRVETRTTTFHVTTEAMDVTATVVRPVEPHTLTLLTLHGAYGDHRTTFTKLAAELRSQPRFAHVQLVHIDLPGYEAAPGEHHIIAPPLAPPHRQDSSTRSPELAAAVDAALAGAPPVPCDTPRRDTPVPHLEAVSGAVLQVMAALGLHMTIGVGVGQGSTALVQASAAQRFAFGTLVLCNPGAPAGAGWYEWAQWSAVKLALDTGASSMALPALRDLALGPSTRHSSVGGGVTTALQGTPRGHIAAYIGATLARPPLDTAALKEQWQRFGTRILGFVGEASTGPLTLWPYTGDGAALMAVMACADASLGAWEGLPYAGGMVPLDEPARMLNALGMVLLALGHGGMVEG